MKDKVVHGECNEVMQGMAEESIDLTVTSPPYDNMRSYKGYDFDFKNIANELFRITKNGGVVVWIVGDATIKGSETGTSFRQVLYFKEIGFNVETMIWEKTGSGCLGSNKFYNQNFEFMFILTKGMPKTTNFIRDRPNKVKSGMVKVNGSINKEGVSKTRTIERKPFGKRNNIWCFDTQKNSNHPAPFPEQLANDHIITWSNEGDIVFDPMCGSGTTLIMAKKNNRHYIGIDIAEEYVELSRTRLLE